MFPNESSQTHLSINLQSSQGNEAYGYTYQATLKAGYPYHFTGNYKGGVTLDGEFQAEGWQPEIDCEFGFDEILPDEGEDDGNDEGTNDGNSGNTGGEDSSGNNDTEYDTFIVSEMPGADSIWGYFYVWQTTSISSTEAEAIIIAPEQWYTFRRRCSGFAGYLFRRRHRRMENVYNGRSYSVPEPISGIGQ